MTERRSQPRRAEDRLLRGLRYASRLMAAMALAFTSGIALIVTVRSAWHELIKAWLR